MTTAALITETISLGLAFSLRGLVHLYHGGKQDNVRADMMLEK